METTVASCHGDVLITLVTVIPLFPPGIAVVVVAVDFPEPRLVLLHEAQAADPFCGLPEIQVWHEETRRAAVLGRQWLALILPHDRRLSLQHILNRQVRRIPAVAEGHEE